MPVYLASDGFLHQGADVLELKERPDGLLWLFGPDSGAPPPVSDSGLLSSVAAFAGAEALAELFDLTTVGVLTGTEALAEIGDVITVSVLTRRRVRWTYGELPGWTYRGVG